MGPTLPKPYSTAQLMCMQPTGSPFQVAAPLQPLLPLSASPPILMSHHQQHQRQSACCSNTLHTQHAIHGHGCSHRCQTCFIAGETVGRGYDGQVPTGGDARVSCPEPFTKADLDLPSRISTRMVVAAHPSRVGRRAGGRPKAEGVSTALPYKWAAKGSADARCIASHSIHCSTGACAWPGCWVEQCKRGKCFWTMCLNLNFEDRVGREVWSHACKTGHARGPCPLLPLP